MPLSLEDRFTTFLASLPNAERIDDFVVPKDQKHRRKADFLLGNRQVVVELKTLTEDPSHKVESAVEEHRQREDFPLFFGEADVRKVLSHLPDGEAIYGRMVNALGRSLEGAVRSAEEQTTHTRKVFRIPEAVGLLVILNESVEILDPSFVGHRVAQLLRRKRTGNSDADKLDFVWLLFESHAMGRAGNVPVMPSILIRGEGAARFPWFSAFHSDVVRRWVGFNGGTILNGVSPDPKTLSFKATSDVMAPPPAQLKRHEVWRQQYRASPHLRHLSDAAVLAQCRDVAQKLAPHFLEGGPGYVEQLVLPLLEEFTHAEEEATSRALDWRGPTR